MPWPVVVSHRVYDKDSPLFFPKLATPTASTLNGKEGCRLRTYSMVCTTCVSCSREMEANVFCVLSLRETLLCDHLCHDRLGFIVHSCPRGNPSFAKKSAGIAGLSHLRRLRLLPCHVNLLSKNSAAFGQNVRGWCRCAGALAYDGGRRYPLQSNIILDANLVLDRFVASKAILAGALQKTHGRSPEKVHPISTGCVDLLLDSELSCPMATKVVAERCHSLWSVAW